MGGNTQTVVHDDEFAVNPGEDDDLEIELADAGEEDGEEEAAPGEPAGEVEAPPAGGEEETTDEDLDQFSNKARKRFKQLTDGFQEERRRRETLEAEKAQLTAEAVRIAKENEELQKAIQKSHTAQLETARHVVNNEIEAAKRELREAYERGDSDAVVSASEKLTEAKVKLQRVNSVRLPSLQTNRSVQEYSQPPTHVPRDPRADEWVARNTWMQTDPAMRNYALFLHEELTRKHRVDPRSDEYYRQIESRLRKEFPSAQINGFFPAETEEKPRASARPPVAAVTRNTSGNKQKVRLEQGEVEIARQLGVPLAAYAKEKLRLEREKRENRK